MEGKRKQEVKRNSQEHEAVVRVQREKIISGRKKDKKFESESGVPSQIAQHDLPSVIKSFTLWRNMCSLFNSCFDTISQLFLLFRSHR